MSHDGPRYSSIGDYLRVIRRRWLLILLPALVGFGAAYAVSKRSAATYRAAAMVSIQDSTQLLDLLGTSVTPGTAPGSESPAVVAQTAVTPALAEQVKHHLHSRLASSQLASMLSVSVTPIGLLKVQASAPSASLASRLANAFAAQIAASTTASARSEFASALSSLERRRAALNPAKVSDQAEYATIEGDISRVEFLHSNARPGRVAALAHPPGSPASPKPLRNGALGLLAGLLIGLVLAFGRESFDRRLSGPTTIEAELDYRILGQLRSRALGRVVSPSLVLDKDAADDVETFRIIRRNLDFLTGDRRHRAILVTSALPKEGKSTVAASLALSAAAMGQRTLLIETDLRSPTLADKLGVARGPGLTEYLLDEANSGDIVQLIPGRAPADGGKAVSAGDTRAPSYDAPLACITAGGPSPRSAELLASPRMRSVVNEVTEVYDLVLIDATPLLPVADALELVSYVDGIVLCVRSGNIKREQARAAKAALWQFPPDSIGLVVTGVRSGGAAGYGRYPYRQSSDEPIKV